MSTQITFTPDQISYLRDWFVNQSKQYVETVMDDDFEADEETFERLCGSTFNVSGFREGIIETNREIKVKKTRKKKDPNEPKRPKSAYMCWLWSDDGVNKVKEENEGIAHKDSVSKASAKWKEMTDDDKTPWTIMSSNEKEKYISNMKEYTAKRDGTQTNSEESQESNDDTNEDTNEDIEGFTKMVDKFINGYSSAGKNKFDTLQDAIKAMSEDSGGIVYHDNKYTIRKIGPVKLSKKNEILWIKK